MIHDVTNTSRASIIVNNHNYARFLRQALDSALAQSYPDTEVIVVDDGSKDRTGAAAETTGVRVLSNRTNMGYGASLKRGVAASDSTYVAIIDADGTYPASNLPRMLEIARSVDMVVGARSTSMTNVPLIRRPAKFILNNFAIDNKALRRILLQL